MKPILERKWRKEDPIGLRKRTDLGLFAEQRLLVGRPAQIIM
jgi:hypothetical protein